MSGGRSHVILVHGMWSRPAVWDLWKSTLEEAGFPCTAVSLPGHESADNDEAVRGLGLVDYVNAVTNIALRFERPIVIGHSLGGLVAQHVAVRHRLDALVLVSSAAPGQVFPLRPVVLPGVARHFLRLDLWRKSFRLNGFESKHLLFGAMPADRQSAMHGNLAAESGRIIYEVGFGRLNLSGSNRVAIDAIECPTLILAGERDHIIPIGVSRRTAKLYGPKATYIEYPQHAHWMLGEDGAQTRAAEVTQWLQARTASVSAEA